MESPLTGVVERPPVAAPELLQPLAGILASAIASRATDIHLDVWNGRGCLRFRVDGVAREQAPVSAELARRLVNQVKVAAGLDLAAILRPMEGQFRWQSGALARDIRVTMIPEAPNNEALHLRLLTPPAEWQHLEQLGLSAAQVEQLRRALRRPNGMVLVAGPTGAGKTTTLYALTELEDLRTRVAASIEDPIEFDLPHVRQLEVDERRGVSMHEGLRTLLRMDAELLLVGEIRDADSARVAAQAALTGRHVLATIHGHDAAGAIHALHYFAVPYQVIGGALRLVIAQHLLRRVCRACAEPRELTAYAHELFARHGLAPPASLLHPRGCADCGGCGYRGRSGVFEIALLDDDFGHWLADQRHSQQELRDRLIAQGTKPLVVSALESVAAGVTALPEMLRVFWGGLEDPSDAAPEPDGPSSVRCADGA